MGDSCNNVLNVPLGLAKRSMSEDPAPTGVFGGCCSLIFFSEVSFLVSSTGSGVGGWSRSGEAEGLRSVRLVSACSPAPSSSILVSVPVPRVPRVPAPFLVPESESEAAAMGVSGSIPVETEGFLPVLSLRSPRRAGSTRSPLVEAVEASAEALAESVVALGASSSLELELDPEEDPLDPDEPPDELELLPESEDFFFALAAAASLLLAVLTTSGRGWEEYQNQLG